MRHQRNNKLSHAEQRASAYNQLKRTSYPSPAEFSADAPLFRPGIVDAGEVEELDPACGMVDAFDMAGDLVSKAVQEYAHIPVDAVQANEIAASADRFADYLRELSSLFSALHKEEQS